MPGGQGGTQDVDQRTGRAEDHPLNKVGSLGVSLSMGKAQWLRVMGESENVGCCYKSGAVPII